MGGKRDAWQQITHDVKAATQGGKDITFARDAGKRALYAVEAARRALEGIGDQANGLGIQNASFGEAGNTAGQRLRDVFIEQQKQLQDVVKDFGKAFVHMQDMFGHASTLFRDRERDSAASFNFESAKLDEAVKPYRIPDGELTHSAKGEADGEVARGAKGETIDPAAVGDDGVAAKGAPAAPPPPTAMSPTSLATLGKTIETSTMVDTAVQWVRMSRQVDRLAYQFAKDMNSAFNEWEGVGQRAAKQANESYIKNLNTLSARMQVMGRVLADTAGWLYATKKNMPVDGVRDRVNLAIISSNTIWTRYRTNDGDLDELPEIRDNYEKYYVQPMSATKVPVIPDFAAATSAQPKAGDTDPKKDDADKKNGAPGAGPQGGGPTPQNGNQNQSGQTEQMKKGVKDLDKATKNLQKDLDKVEQGANQITKGQESISKGTDLIARGSQLKQLGAQEIAAGRVQEGLAHIAQGDRLIAQGKDKITDGQKLIKDGQREMKSALAEIKGRDAKELARAEKDLRDAAKNAPNAQQKAVDQAIKDAEKYRKSATAQAEKITGRYTEAGDKILKDSNQILKNADQVGTAAAAQPGTSTDPGSTATTTTPDPIATTDPTQANAADPTSANATAPGGADPGLANTAPTNPTTPGTLQADPVSPAAGSPYTPAANAAPSTGQDPLSQLAGIAQQIGSFAQQAGQGLGSLIQAASLPHAALPGLDIPGTMPDPGRGVEPGGLGGGPGPGPGPGPTGTEPTRDYTAKPIPREGGVQPSGLEPRAGIPAGYQQPMMGTPGAPGAGVPPGGAGQGNEHKRPKFLHSDEHLEEALGEAPVVYKAVIDR
ncbi:hypothetical protein [Nocardia asiatica]|uniref:hypothetical protein n=1 Tax=Nocardia asiatica TaxID=209252 RepID=UPI0024590378|nr:hypothetical protein [Nocardia asiatica]